MNAPVKHCITALAAAAALALGPWANAAEKVRWKVPIAFGTNLPALGDTAIYVSEQLSVATNGDIQLKIFEPGKLVPPFQIFDAVKDRKVEAGYTWLGYDQGKIPASPLLSAVPFGLEPWEFTAWWYEGGGQKLAEELYHPEGVHVVLCGIMGPEAAGWFRKEIKSLDDLKGLKIRFAGLGGKVMQKLGASVTVLPGGEIFPALEKGAIDATEFSMPAIDEKLGFYKVVKNYYFPGWHQTFTSLHLMVNKGLWDKIEKGSKAAIDMACSAATMRSMSKGEHAQIAAMKSFAEKGVKAQVLPEKLLRELEKATKEVLAEESKNNAAFKKIYESQRAFDAAYKPWKDKAYLPRNW
jgi:TRAP-type mannitol/chloroaromatic compound transport system substrate-binding protein